VASYSEIVSQIEELKKEAEKLRKAEYSSVLKAIKRQIIEYGISAHELGLVSPVPSGKRVGKVLVSKKSKRGSNRRLGARDSHPLAGSKIAPRYRDENGNTWTGRGKQPNWIREALASGRRLESFLIPQPVITG
jgi:DNA-binding protein H-NS